MQCSSSGMAAVTPFYSGSIYITVCKGQQFEIVMGTGEHTETVPCVKALHKGLKGRCFNFISSSAAPSRDQVEKRQPFLIGFPVTIVLLLLLVLFFFILRHFRAKNSRSMRGGGRPRQRLQ